MLVVMSALNRVCCFRDFAVDERVSGDDQPWSQQFDERGNAPTEGKSPEEQDTSADRASGGKDYVRR